MITEQLHDSSIIEKTTFDDVAKTLTVTFKNGSEYEYSDFEQSEYDSFLAAPSQGSYFSKNIAHLYTFRKL
jgi:hypothetical protein